MQDLGKLQHVVVEQSALQQAAAEHAAQAQARFLQQAPGGPRITSAVQPVQPALKAGGRAEPDED